MNDEGAELPVLPDLESMKQRDKEQMNTKVLKYK